MFFQDSMRQSLDASPRTSMKSHRSLTFNNSPRQTTTSPRGRHSVSGPPSNTNKSFSEEDSIGEVLEDLDLLHLDDSSSLVDHNNDEVRAISPSSSTYSVRSETFSPKSTSTQNAMGTCEHRLSIRRYEMDKMEPRSIPHEATHESDLEISSPPPIPVRKPGTPVDKLLANQNFGTREQRGSLRKMQRKSLAEKIHSQSSSPSIPRRKDVENNNTPPPAHDGTTPNKKEGKKNDTWYEYGSV